MNRYNPYDGYSQGNGGNRRGGFQQSSGRGRGGPPLGSTGQGGNLPGGPGYIPQGFQPGVAEPFAAGYGHSTPSGGLRGSGRGGPGSFGPDRQSHQPYTAPIPQRGAVQQRGRGRGFSNPSLGPRPLVQVQNDVPFAGGSNGPAYNQYDQHPSDFTQSSRSPSLGNYNDQQSGAYSQEYAYDGPPRRGVTASFKGMLVICPNPPLSFMSGPTYELCLEGKSPAQDHLEVL